VAEVTPDRSTVVAVLVVAGLGVASACSDRTANAATEAKELVLVGKVVAIAKRGGDARRPWIVTVKVENVVSGERSGRQLELALHSFPMSVLEVGHTYTIRAVRTGDDSHVVATAWLRGNGRRPLAPDPWPVVKRPPGRCDPLYDQLRQEYEAFLSARRQCRNKADCDLAMAQCPLPIYSAVASGAKREVQELAERLVERTGPPHCFCVADVGPPEVACRKGTCTEVTRRY
jgi:hypothetical protein